MVLQFMRNLIALLLQVEKNHRSKLEVLRVVYTRIDDVHLDHDLLQALVCGEWWADL